MRSILIFILLFGCDPYPDARPQTPEEKQITSKVIQAWGYVNQVCIRNIYDTRILWADNELVDILCGRSVFACAQISDGVIILRETFIGTYSEKTLLAHEDVHVLAACAAGSADSWHTRSDYWIKPDICLHVSVEGRARLLLGLDGCDISPSNVCCYI